MDTRYPGGLPQVVHHLLVGSVSQGVACLTQEEAGHCIAAGVPRPHEGTLRTKSLVYPPSHVHDAFLLAGAQRGRLTGSLAPSFIRCGIMPD
jgi:hypothetical protein